MKPFRLTRRALGSAVCMTLLAGTVLFTSPTPVHAAAQGKDTLVFVNYRDLRDLNPHLYAGEMFAQEMVFEGLVTLGNDASITEQLPKAGTSRPTAACTPSKFART